MKMDGTEPFENHMKMDGTEPIFYRKPYYVGVSVCRFSIAVAVGTSCFIQCKFLIFNSRPGHNT